MIITKTSTTPQELRESLSQTQSLFRIAAVQMASGPKVQATCRKPRGWSNWPPRRARASSRCPSISRSWV